MPDQPTAAPDSTAVRTALWRAMHVQVDPPPHVLQDELGLELAAPDESWRNRQDMHPQWTRRIRASIVARAECRIRNMNCNFRASSALASRLAPLSAKDGSYHRHVLQRQDLTLGPDRRAR